MAEEYESLPTSRISTIMCAGAAAGMAEHLFIYPVDCVKTRMQSLVGPQHGGIVRTLQHMTQVEGPRTLFRGIGTVAAGAAPAHALYFGCYETAKQALSRPSISGEDHLANAVSGAVATVAHDGFMNPVDVVKQRLQMARSPFTNALHCIVSVWKAEGLRAFYRSYTTQLTMNIPFQSTNFVVYEAVRQHLNPNKEFNPLVHVIAGGMAGATAAAVTNPLDVAKTLLNTQQAANVHQPSIRGMWHALRTINAAHGPAGFVRGMRARVVFQAPGTAVCWSVYELFKHYIRQRDGDDCSEAATSLAESFTQLKVLA